MIDIETIRKLAIDARQRDLELHNLQDTMENLLIIPYNGGLWKITHELINTVHLYSTLYPDECILLDACNIPRKVNPSIFLHLLVSKHQEIMNEWYVEYANNYK